MRPDIDLHTKQDLKNTPRVIPGPISATDGRTDTCHMMAEATRMGSRRHMNQEGSNDWPFSSGGVSVGRHKCRKKKTARGIRFKERPPRPGYWFNAEYGRMRGHFGGGTSGTESAGQKEGHIVNRSRPPRVPAPFPDINVSKTTLSAAKCFLCGPAYIYSVGTN